VAKRFTAEEVAEKLREEGDKGITKRTVNYYAFDKNMFEISLRGKKIFTEKEIDKIRAVRMLKEYTSCNLTEIKKIINLKDLEEIKEMCLKRAEEMRHSLQLAELSEKNSLLKQRRHRSFPSDDYDMDNYQKGRRTIKINDDVRLVVSSSVDDEKILKIIGQIKKIF